MNKLGLIFALVLFIGLSGYVSGLFYLIVHEQAHVAVFNKYGIDSISQYQYIMLSAGTIPNQEQYDIKCSDYCKSDQLNIDAVGYHIALLIFSIHMLSSMLICFYIIILKPKDLNTHVS